MTYHHGKKTKNTIFAEDFSSSYHQILEKHFQIKIHYYGIFN